MTLPTVLSPWYVLQKIKLTGHTSMEEVLFPLEYYTAMDDGGTIFQTDPKRAMIFQSLHTVARIASAEGAHIRVLIDESDAREFGRDKL